MWQELNLDAVRCKLTEARSAIDMMEMIFMLRTVLCNHPDTNSIVGTDIFLYSIVGAVKTPVRATARTVLLLPWMRTRTMGNGQFYISSHLCAFGGDDYDTGLY